MKNPIIYQAKQTLISMCIDTRLDDETFVSNLEIFAEKCRETLDQEKMKLGGVVDARKKED